MTRRKLINYDVFERIEKDSLSTAQDELINAAPVLTKALQTEGLQLHCYGAEDVLYESRDGFIHASYQIQEGYIEFDNVEELVISEETEIIKQKELISEMLDSLLENDSTEKADNIFEQIMTLPRTQRVFSEMKKDRADPIRQDGKVRFKKAKWDVDDDADSELSGITAARTRAKKKDSAKQLKSAKRDRVKKTIGEWANLAENVFDYLDYKKFGPVLKESEVRRDEQGNVLAVRIPTQKIRNEAKLLEFDWKILNTDVIVKRAGAKKIAEDTGFCKSVAELKRHNNMSENNALEETLENIVTKWPVVLYLTQTELAQSVNSS